MQLLIISFLITYLVQHINCQNEIDFMICIPLEECPTLAAVNGSILEKIRQTAACDEDGKTYVCPREDESVCDCKSVYDCKPYKKFIDEKKFSELNQNENL